MNPNRFWEKFRVKRSNQLSSGSAGRHSPSDSNVQASATDYTISHAARVAGAVIPASIGAPISLELEDLHQLSTSSSLIPDSAHNHPTYTDKDQLSTSGVRAPASAGTKPGWKATTYGGAKMVLEVVRESSDVFVPLKSVAGGLSALLSQYDRFVSNKDDVQRLILRVQSLATSLTGPPRDDDTKETARRTQLKSDLGTVLETLDPMSKQSVFSGFLNNAGQATKIAGLVEDIRDAIMDYQTALQQDLNENAFALMESTDLILLDKLRRSKDAGHFSGNRQKCLKGTRVSVLETIENWVHQNGIHRVYWLNGMAGSGKTTIARSLAERMFAGGGLGGSFFCSRDFADRRNLHFIFPTLAFQLAYKYPAFRVNLVKTLKSSPDAGHGSLENQLKKLLVEPLQSTRLSTVIIIDALDECEDDEPASAILSLLAREINKIPSVKFFITGRPESQIREGFRLPALRPQTEILLLHEVERANVNEDIKTFLTHHMKELVKNRSDLDLTTPWPAPEDILAVTLKAAGLFIYASTVIKFLSSPTHTPQERLRMITSMPQSSVYEGKSGIDLLYTCVMERGCAHVHGDDFSFFSRLLLIISSVVLLSEPISVASLAKLLNLDLRGILTPIRSLHSVLLVPEFHSKPIRVLHKSFPDYITDRERCTDSKFYVDPSVYHAKLAVRCFELMKASLKKNICELPQYAMNEDIDDLSTRQEIFIGEVLVYACRFWAKHLCSSSPTGEDVVQILELLKEFVSRLLLQWLEVVSIVKDLRGAVHSLINVERWFVDVKDRDESLMNSICECRRFALYFFDAIEQSAVGIYDSVLLWSPTSSLMRKLYSDQLRTQVKLLNGISNSWDACTRTIQLGNGKDATSVAFSHRGDLIAGCGGHVIKIFEAATGVCLATLKGHNGYVRSVTFSYDDVFLASGSGDHTVRIWDVQTGALVRKLEGNEALVNSVAFSPTGTMVASGADDKTVRIWNLSSGDCLHTLEGHSLPVLSVCWLQTEKVVSGGMDTIKVWDVESGECLKTFDEHSDWVHSVASSPDATKFASGSRDLTIQVYDALTGDIIQTILADEWVYSVHFSPDGEKIAYATGVSVVVQDLVNKISTFEWKSGAMLVAYSPDGSCVAAGLWDGFLKVFQVDSGNQGHGTYDQHSREVSCISVSPDGRMIASGSFDATVKLWDVMTGSCVQTFYGQPDQIISVSFSPDSSLVVYGSKDNIVRIRSVRTSNTAEDPRLYTFDGHDDWVRSVTFSPDSTLVASGSDDTTVRIWDLHDGSIRVLKGHTSFVSGVKFSPDGKRVVSVSKHREIILWDVERWEKLSVWPSPALEELDSRVSFSADGTRIILEFQDMMERWNICTKAQYSFEHTAGPQSSESSSEESSLPIILVPIQDDVLTTPHVDIRQYRFSNETGWIMDKQNRRLCWIPADLRGYNDFYGKKFFIGTTSGKVIIVDLSDISVSYNHE